MKKIIIIGAGITGLAAGIYARRNGYETTIYESHSLPGGMCTGWKRKGFTFEGCMHYILLTGSSPAHVFYDMWKELGVHPGLKMIDYDIFHTFQDAAGRTFSLYGNAGRLEKQMLALSPVDAAASRALCRSLKRYAWFIRKTGLNPFLLLAKLFNILLGIPYLKKYGNMNLTEYTACFKDPLIRQAFSEIFVYPDFAYTQFCFYLAGWHIGGIAFPQGGSLALAKRIAQTFLGLNGQIVYRQSVKRIIVVNGRAAGIELADGTQVKADIVISAADGRSTLQDMLEDRFTPPAVRERYAAKALYQSFIQVSLGVNRDPAGSPHNVKAVTAAPFEVAGRLRRELWYQHFAADPTMAPQGKSVFTVLYPTTYDWWEKISYRSDAYKAEKQKILETTVAQLEKFFPGISQQIVVSDVSTPHTMHRYTNNWKGALGFILTQDLAAEMTMKTQYTLPGLADFYMAGQWVKGFGVPIAAMAGKEVIQKLCRDDGRKFKAR